MPPSVLTTKLYVPRVRPELVPRPRLIEQLDAGLHRKLTLISAPAGFGKTTLLSAWIRSKDGASSEARREGSPALRAAWVSLDDSDNDPARFLAYVITALQQVDPQIAHDVLGLLQSGQSPPTQAVLTAVINHVHTVPDQVVLVLDDYHLIAAQPVHGAVAFLLEHLPGNMHLVIATRSDPPLQLARLRARGQLTEIRQVDLRFTAEEAAAFLTDVVGLDLAPEDVSALEARTEGWIAGLQMAALAMQACSATAPLPGAPSSVPGEGKMYPTRSLSGFVRAFTGSHRFILDYLVEEVLDQQPPATQEFLLKTSILRRLTGPLCDALLGMQPAQDPPPLAPASFVAPGSPSPHLLEDLEAANLFIIPLDDERCWYRYHRLFADLLQKRLRQLHPALEPELHRRASEWCARNGLVADAIQHALSAGELERAADLVEQAAEATMMRSEVITLLRWIERLPEELIRIRPDLCIYHAWAMLLSGRPWKRVESRLEDLARLERTAEDTDPVAGRAAALRAWVSVFQGHIPRAAEWSRQALEQLPKGDSFLRSIALMNLGLSYLAEGDLAAGSQALEDVARACQETGNTMIAVMVLCMLAEQCMKRAQLHEAKEIYQQALDVATDGQGRLLPIAGEALMGLGELARRWNDLEAAVRYVTEGIELAGQWSKVGTLDGYLTLVRLGQAKGDFKGAAEALQTAREVAIQFDATELDDHVVALQQAWLWIDQGNFDAVERWAEERGLHQEMDAPASAESDAYVDYHLRKYEHLVLVRLCLAQGRPEDALALLDPLVERLERRGRRDLTIQALALKALALEAQGQVYLALSTLEQALTLAEPGGDICAFADEGPPMARLLSKILAQPHGGHGISSTYIHKLVAAFDEAHPGAPAGVPPPARQPLVDPLTERELEVLRLLATGMSNPEIADGLVIAVSTVRSHLKNIYSKLDVHKRWDAVQRGQELGLL
jgi:LuxR family maltose regulon positive regulatory protein